MPSAWEGLISSESIKSRESGFQACLQCLITLSSEGNDTLVWQPALNLAPVSRQCFPKMDEDISQLPAHPHLINLIVPKWSQCNSLCWARSSGENWKCPGNSRAMVTGSRGWPCSYSLTARDLLRLVSPSSIKPFMWLAYKMLSRGRGLPITTTGLSHIHWLLGLHAIDLKVPHHYFIVLISLWLEQLTHNITASLCSSVSLLTPLDLFHRAYAIKTNISPETWCIVLDLAK